MRTSQYLLATMREAPNDAEIISHQLMLRAGMIRRAASGLYSWLPTGVKVMQKVAQIVREEMNRAGAIELLMPAVHPAELWQESGRWDDMGPELLRIQDRHGRDFCLSPTHEEVMTDIVRNEINSYKQLPINFYQIQTKFRDEVRPRFGVMRSREFIMKDAYSFHLDEACLKQTYQAMYDAYSRSFERMALKFRAVEADNGAIGGSGSHEFHVLADSGEDAIAFSDGSDYAANVEKATCLAPQAERPAASKAFEVIDTPNVAKIEDISAFLKEPKRRCLKTLLVKASEDTEHEVIALVLCGDHQLNEVKAQNHALVAAPLQMATEEQVIKHCGCIPGYIGPKDLQVPVLVDRDAAVLSDFVCGANEVDKHFINVNWDRDAQITEVVDIRNVAAGDLSPDGQGKLAIARGIEVGHIFQLGTKYSQSMKATVLNENGKAIEMPMGCYGIGITRIVAAAIEQNHDDKGIIWPDAIAPFQIALLPMNMHKSQRVKEKAEQIYQQLVEAGYEVIFDDRKERPGVMFADMELIGIPHRLVIGEKGIDDGSIEYKGRQEKDNTVVAYDQLMSFLQEKLG